MVFFKIICVLIVLVLFEMPCFGESFFEGFKDPKDGAFDASRWLIDQKGFLPVPVIITEPAVGYGAGAGLLFFHQSVRDAQKAKVEKEDEVLSLPPSMSGLFGAYTENDSWFAGGGHFGSWKNDTIRYTGGLAWASLNLKFYGAGNIPILNERPLNFSIEGPFLLQELKFRIPNTKLFLGGRYEYLSSKVTFDFTETFPRLPIIQRETTNASLGLLANYDSRDNIMTPNRGQYLELILSRYDDAFGGDFEYNELEAKIRSWWGIHSDVVLGVRLDGDFTSGRVPFYALPYIDLRGIPAQRYQGDKVFVVEVEPRWDFTDRWSLAGFLGAGWAVNSTREFDDNDPKVAGGIGFRYLIARRMGLRYGVDVAFGPEETAVYITAGTSWH